MRGAFLKKRTEAVGFMLSMDTLTARSLNTSERKLTTWPSTIPIMAQMVPH